MTTSGAAAFLPLGLLVLLATAGCGSEKLEQIQSTQEEILAKLGELDARLERLAPTRGARRVEDDSKVHAIDVDSSPVRGRAEAPITLVEFSDFQCPLCAQVTPPILALQKKYPDQVRIVFKHFPLAFHKAGQLAALASMAAQEQDRFWEFHDLLFENQRLLTGDLEQLAGLAKQAGLDVARFRADLESKRSLYEQRLAEDQSHARSAGVRESPTLYLNGQKVRDRNFAGLSAMVEAALGEAKGG